MSYRNKPGSNKWKRNILNKMTEDVCDAGLNNDKISPEKIVAVIKSVRKQRSTN